MKNNSIQKNTGITLIALVITIIVLLILAGISISMLTGENGLLTKSSDAKRETDNQSELEQIKLAVLAAITEGNGKIKDEDLRNELKNNIKEIRNENITGNEEKGWKINIYNKNYTVSPNGVVEEKQIEDRTGLEIGDYVDYKYDGQETYELAGNISGYRSSVEKYYEKNEPNPTDFTDKTYTRANSMSWRILRIDYETGEIDLIGTQNATNEPIYLQGSRGYNNAVFVENDIAGKMFSNSRLGNKAIARALNIDDYEQYYITDTEGKGIKLRNSYQYSSESRVTTYGGNGATAISGTTQEYTGSRYYPLIYDKEKYSGVDSDTVKITGLDRNEGRDMGTFAQANTKITSTQTSYDLRYDNLIDVNIIESGVLPRSADFASRCAQCYSGFVNYGMFFISYSDFNIGTLFKSTSYASTSEIKLRPVISLSSDIKILTDKDGKSEANARTIEGL